MSGGGQAGEQPFKKLSSKIVWTSPWYRIRQDELLLPGGQPGVYNVVEHPGAVWIVPVTDQGEIVLVHHYRYTVDDWCWEVPAGGLTPGLSPVETAEIELLEEIGGIARQLDYVGCFYTANGISNEKAHVFLAGGVELGPTRHEPAEVMEVNPRPVEEVLHMAHNNAISDGPSALAILLCEQKLLALCSNR